MSSIKKVGWIALSVALIAIVLMVTACGGGNEENAGTTPTAKSTVGAGDSTGVTDTEIKLGTHYPLTGSPAAAWAPIAYGMRAYFDYINAQGGVYGRKITLLIGDDQYNPANTVEVVRKLVEQDKVFGIISGLGEATHLAVYRYLEENGIPDMALSSGLEMWTNPVAHNRFTATVTYD